MGYASAILPLLFPALILLHLLVAPYTKVEESFHVQAVHDILANGLPTSFNDSTLDRINYDHFSFPGAVPRSALGAAALAMLSKPVIWLNEGINQQLLARAVLGLLNASALAAYASGLRRSFGQLVAIWYILFQASQFHMIYYASRPLSNMFAFSIATLAMRLLLPSPRSTIQDRKQCSLALILLTIVGVVFRSELALLIGTQTLFLLATRRIGLKDAIFAGLIGLTTGLVLTVTIDGFFWQRFPLWAEFEAFRFNVLAGQSSEWGTEPWSFYFFNALPRLLFNPLSYLLAIPVALRQPATRSPALALLVPALSFVALYSFQPHKEWRFIVYIIPSLTATAALGAAYLWTHRSRSLFARLATRALALSTLAVFCLSNLVLLPASAANYPGGQALDALHHQHAIMYNATDLHSKPESPINVYFGNLACQTGVTRFLQQHPSSGWVYDKTEDKATKSTTEFWDQFDYVIVETSSDAGVMDPDELSLRHALPDSTWEKVHVVDAFAGISVLKPGAPAKAIAEKRLIGAIAGARAVDLFEDVREHVRSSWLRGWWIEVKMKPRVQVLKRARDIPNV
ncbi:CAZyme family GT22 [Penicillium paradoxum]|uniref:CAZyme family GT22 n=1 Tax=Penicillium paradoxum TaxID=176176 RepID=UPI002549B437|nr:CAZyme family GT22 [Penicillium paradoxum]KAJ5779674.1 CAZyme family GT22 [Penicillium paradoxum]